MDDTTKSALTKAPLSAYHAVDYLGELIVNTRAYRHDIALAGLSLSAFLKKKKHFHPLNTRDY